MINENNIKAFGEQPKLTSLQKLGVKNVEKNEQNSGNTRAFDIVNFYIFCY